MKHICAARVVIHDNGQTSIRPLYQITSGRITYETYEDNEEGGYIERLPTFFVAADNVNDAERIAREILPNPSNDVEYFVVAFESTID